MNIKKEHLRLKKRLEFWNAKLTKLQNQICKHKNKTKTPRGDSGNPMTGRDPSYWYEFECPDCDKRWSTPQ